MSDRPEHAYKLRVLEGTWGIGVDLTAALEESPHAERMQCPFLIDVSALDPPVTLSTIDELNLGVQIVWRACDKLTNGGLIKISSLVLWFPDYQDGGVTLAMVGWLSEELRMVQPSVSVRKDKVLNRYIYDPPLETLA